MGDHVVLFVDRLIAPQQFETGQVEERLPSSSSMPVLPTVSSEKDRSGEEKVVDEEQKPLIQLVECRICQEEDHIKNLETPCTCSGSLKYAHRECVQRWCNEKGDVICEICHEPYKPGYTAPPRLLDETTIDLSGGWTISGAPLDLRDPRILAMETAQRHFLEAEYDEYAATNASGATFCRSAALIILALLLLRHSLSITSDEDDNDPSTYFSLFFLHAAGFLLPCCTMAWAISILHQRRQRQEAAVMAAAEVAFILQSRRGRNLQFTIAPESPATPQQVQPHSLSST